MNSAMCKLLVQNVNSIDLKPVLHEIGLHRVCIVAKAMLDNQVFESSIHAAMYIPDLFEITRAQCQKEGLSAATMTRTDAQAMLDIAEHDQKDCELSMRTIVVENGRGVICATQFDKTIS
ncbi:uncharacterized protein BCR38DRAFT_413318 [Pseudomassariella vexata]|uniref:Uncharacterized protein n=1 Tax=Pseudomassariella vexata TaxID=1141098 RepID=A0A1Y2DGS3_9PEZI|nr:uncharacterized protein BCR38DRAFT_413318 [Pseudomassariella vexata]ORY58461.1 hypothetical protein BCR38DRAFT_413318 [Pseudomassariella vexata]